MQRWASAEVMAEEALEEVLAQIGRQAFASDAAGWATSVETAQSGKVAGRELQVIRDNRVAAEGARLEGARPGSLDAFDVAAGGM